MKTIDGYIGRRLAWGWALVALLLTSLFSITELVNELDKVGKGVYSTADAALFVLLTVPGRLASLIPVSALLGGLLALASLAAGDELTSLQAAGVSTPRLALSILRAAFLLLAAGAVLVQFVAPPLESEAFSRREMALGMWTRVPGEGFWARDGSRFIRVGILRPGLVPADIDIYTLDAGGELRSHIAAEAAEIAGEEWRLRGARETLVTAEGFRRQAGPQTLEVHLSLRQLHLLEREPEALSPVQLFQAAHTLRERGQNPDRYLWAFWQKLALPLKGVAMALFALPFFLGTRPERGTGRRLLLGTVAGIAFYFFDQSLGSLGLLLALPPPLISLAPVLFILALTFWMLRWES